MCTKRGSLKRVDVCQHEHDVDRGLVFYANPHPNPNPNPTSSSRVVHWGHRMQVLVEEGAQVDEGMPLLVLEAMKMEHTVGARW